MENLDTPPGLG